MLKILRLGLLFSAVFWAFIQSAAAGPMANVFPGIRFERNDFFLGERIAFETSKHTDQQMDGPDLEGTVCPLTITRPDGKIIKPMETEVNAYNGPSVISSYSQPQLLNDLDDNIILGTYRLSYQCGSHETSAEIHISASPVTKSIRANIEFPDHLLLQDKVLKTELTVHNDSSQPVTIVVPDTNYLTRSIAYAESENPPLWAIMRTKSETALDKGTDYRTPINSLNAGMLTLHTIAAGESYSQATEFYGTQADGILYSNPQFPAAHDFQITSGTVLYVFPGTDNLAANTSRPLELLVRSKTCYNAAGERALKCIKAISRWPYTMLD